MDHGGPSYNPEFVSQGGYGGGFGAGGVWSILPWLLIFGDRRGGLFGNGGAGEAASTAAINNAANLQFESLQNQINDLSGGIKGLAVDGRLDRIDAAIAASAAQSTSQNQLILQSGDRNKSEIQMATQASFNALSRELAACCCETQKEILQVRNDINFQGAETRNALCEQTHVLTAQANQNTQKILDAINAQTLDQKNETIAELRARCANADHNEAIRQTIIQLGRNNGAGQVAAGGGAGN